MTPPAWLAFLAAAAIGAPLRYLVDGAVQDRTRGTFPWGTLVVNVTGSLLLGLISGLVIYHGWAANSKLVLGTGLCGAYTTFSTFGYETIRLVEEGAIAEAFRNVLGTMVISLAAAGAGLALAAAL